MASAGEQLNLAAANLVRDARKAKGWSQETLAAACGLDRTYVSAIERRKRNITLAALGRILEALELDATAFATAIKG